MKMTLDQRLETKWHPPALNSSATGPCPELDEPAFNQHTSGCISGLISVCGPAAQSLVWDTSFPCTASSPPHGTTRPRAYTAFIAWDVTHNFYGLAISHLNSTCVAVRIRFHNSWIRNTKHGHLYPCRPRTHTSMPNVLQVLQEWMDLDGKMITERWKEGWLWGKGQMIP